MKKLLIAITCLLALVAAIFSLKVVSRASSKGYLRANATPVGRPIVSRDGRYKIVLYRYPKLKNIPEAFGFGQGFVQLQNASGQVMAEKDAEQLDGLNHFWWSSNKVGVSGFVEWDLPR